MTVTGASRFKLLKQLEALGANLTEQQVADALAVSVMSQAEAEAGTATTIRFVTAQRLAQAIAALESGAAAATTTTNFDGILSGTEDTVQKALDVLDDILKSAITVTGNITASGGDIEATSTDGGSGAGPDLILYRNSATPADADDIGRVKFDGEDDGDNRVTYASIQGVARDVAVANGIDGSIEWNVLAGGTLGKKMELFQGLVIGSPTGGDPGAGKVNATGYEIDGSDITTSGDVPGALIAIIEEQQTSGTNGGGFTSGADQTRTLNTLVYNRGTLVSLASNQFTLPAGNWEIEWSAPAYQVAQHQSMLQDITGTATLARGTQEIGGTATNVQTRSVGSYRVSPGSSNAYEIRHVCNTTNSTDGSGIAGSFGTEVFTRVIIRRA